MLNFWSWPLVTTTVGRSAARTALAVAATAIGAVIGPGIGGLLGPALGLNTLFLGVAGASALGAMFVLLFAQDEAERRSAEPSAPGRLPSVAGFLQSTARDLVDVWQNPRLRSALILVFAIQFGLGASNPLLEIHVADLSGFDSAKAARLTGALFSVMALINIAALPRWGRFGDVHGHSRGLLICAVSTAIALSLHGLAPWLWLLFVARALLGGAVAGISPLSFGLAATETAVDRRGGAIGAVFSARTLAISISAMSGGYMSRFVGIRGLFLLGGGLVLLSGRRAGALGPRARARVASDQRLKARSSPGENSPRKRMPPGRSSPSIQAKAPLPSSIGPGSCARSICLKPHIASSAS